MDAEQLVQLFDSYWFDQEIITKKPNLPPQKNPPLQIQEETENLPELTRVPSSRHVRSLSDQLIRSSSKTSSFSGTESPVSVLSSHKLQTIFSGKHVHEEAEEIIITKENHTEISTDNSKKPIFDISSSFETEKHSTLKRKRRTNKKSSRSLSDLEFDELKGFMDLGFVFSEEDVNSSTLVSILPGLQRLGKRNGSDENIEINEMIPSRPYLSESWAVQMHSRKSAGNPLKIKLRGVSDLSSEIHMKDHLRSWAHTVASAVR